VKPLLLLVTCTAALAQVSKYDKAIFQKPIPADELASLIRLDGARAGDVVRDKQFHAVMRGVIPDCMFHYGWDMPRGEAVDLVLKGSPVPSQLREGRYLAVYGQAGPYLSGRGFVWMDLQDGIGLGAFFFHPTNGEPTPTLTVFSRQVKEKTLSMTQLPPEFARDLIAWLDASRIPPLTARYFIGGSNKRILLEHDEDYCAAAGGPTSAPDAPCRLMEADAADIDLNTAYYLEQVHYATNATAWMIVGPDQTAWLRVREGACRVDPDPVRCRIGMTRERTHSIIRRVH
jgi:uncharacterized protein YecT (DUF1311 family)